MLLGIAAEVWFPVVSVLLGATSTGLISLLADRRRDEKDRIAREEQRQDEWRLRRFEFQRGTLLDLQEGLITLVRLANEAFFVDQQTHRAGQRWRSNKLSEPLNTDFMLAQRRVSLLKVRVLDDDIRARVDAMGATINRMTFADTVDDAEQALQDTGLQYVDLNERVGRALRTIDSGQLAVLG